MLSKGGPNTLMPVEDRSVLLSYTREDFNYMCRISAEKVYVQIQIHCIYLYFFNGNSVRKELIHGGPEWRIYTSVRYIIIGSDNGLSTLRCHAIIWVNGNLLPNGPFGANLSEMCIKIQQHSYRKMNYKISSAKWRSFWYVKLSLISNTTVVLPLLRHVFIYTN